jgi:hypothetical protein
MSAHRGSRHRANRTAVPFLTPRETFALHDDLATFNQVSQFRRLPSRPTRRRSFRSTSIRPRTRWLDRLVCRNSDAKNLI